MAHRLLDYETIIHSAGHRVTPQRIAVLDAVCEGGGHTTLGQIYARVRAIDRSIDRSTVYRTLHLFTQLGIVVSADTGDGETRYEVARPQRHHHLVCRRCGREWEIDHAVVQRMFDEIRRETGFTADTDHLLLFGLCADCAALQGGA